MSTAPILDLSHTITDGLTTYRGLPAPRITVFMSRLASHEHYAEGTEFHIGRIDMVANTGTYVDVPFHRYADGDDLAAVEVRRLANLEGVLVSVPNTTQAIGPEHFAGVKLTGRAVLVHTGWDRHWTQEAYFSGHPYLTAECGEMLREQKAALVGIDSLNIDDTSTGHRRVHSTLLGAGIPIVEHMTNLNALPATGFTMHAAPVKVKGMGTFPVRAYAIVG